jgi:hypothetical protein
MLLGSRVVASRNVSMPPAVLDGLRRARTGVVSLGVLQEYFVNHYAEAACRRADSAPKVELLAEFAVRQAERVTN